MENIVLSWMLTSVRSAKIITMEVKAPKLV